MAFSGRFLLDKRQLLRSIPYGHHGGCLGDYENAQLPSSRRLAAQCFCYAGMCLSALWFVNNVRVHQYILYWWRKAAAIEKHLNGPEETRLVLEYDKHRLPRLIPGDYHLWMNSVPVLFVIIWV